MSQRSLLYGVHDTPPLLMRIMLGLQYAILTIPGTVITPLIVANIIGISQVQQQMLVFVTMLVSAVSTFIQIRKFGAIGSGYLLFLGSSSAYIAAAITAGFMGGLPLICTMNILSAPLEVLMARWLRHLRKIITPMMGGIVIILIAIGVTPIMMQMWTGRPDALDYCSMENLMMGAVTLLVTIGAAIFGKAKLRLWSPLLGLAAGVAVAAYFGKVDFAPLANQPWIGLPQGRWVWPQVHLSAAHIPVFIAFLFATFASTIESVGDSITAQQTSDPDFKKVDYTAVQGTLYADGLGNLLSGLCGTLPNTTYSGNIAVISLTGVASRSVGYIACGIMAALAFMPKLVFSLTLIPQPVIGASTLVLMGLLYAAGMKLIAVDGVSYESALIVGVSLSAGIISSFKLFFPELMPDAVKPFIENGVATGGIIALLLSLVLRLRPAGRLSFVLDADVACLEQLALQVQKLARKYGLDAVKTNNLQLVCEELFVYLADAPGGTERSIRFRFEQADQAVLVEVDDKGDFGDVDDVNGELQSTDQLGLFLLNRVARKVEHLRFGEYHAIHCEIE